MNIEDKAGFWMLDTSIYAQMKPTMDLTAQARQPSEICDQLVKFSEELLIYAQLTMGCTQHMQEIYRIKIRNVKEQVQKYQEARFWYLEQFRP